MRPARNEARFPAPRRTSIVLIDWSRRDEITATSRDEFLYELMLLSLLYDEILVQDEVLLCSKKMARWFPESGSFAEIEGFFDTGGLVVLKRPPWKYPEDLQGLAIEAPIKARRNHLERFSVTNDGLPCRFSRKQVAFQDRLEACIRDHCSSSRAAGKHAAGRDLMQEFRDECSRVLTDERYRKWLRSRFPRSVSDSAISSMADEYSRFVSQPHIAVDRIRNLGLQPRFTPLGDGCEFNTALAVQVAGTWPPPLAAAMQGIVETVFARPFCEHEGAKGRYGKALRELPLTVDELRGLTASSDIRKVVRVETMVSSQMCLPALDINFAKIIREARDSDAGKNLRRMMARLGENVSFKQQLDAWQAVAQEIANRSVRTREITLWSVGASILGGYFAGVLADWIFAARPTGEVHFWFPTKLAGGAFAIAGRYFYHLACLGLEREELSRQLYGSLQIECVDMPLLNQRSKRGSAEFVCNSAARNVGE